MKWFGYSAEGNGFELFDTEDEARAYAQKELDLATGDCLPETPGMEGIWGRVHGLPRQVAHIETPNGEYDWLEQWELRSPDEEITIKRIRRWEDEHGDEHEEPIQEPTS